MNTGSAGDPKQPSAAQPQQRARPTVEPLIVNELDAAAARYLEAAGAMLDPVCFGWSGDEASATRGQRHGGG